MKKLCLITITVMIIFAMCTFDVSAAKKYGFVDNKVGIILTEEASERVYNGELIINKAYFEDYDIGVKKIDSGYLSKTFAHYSIILDKHDHENVLRVVEILKENEDFRSVEPCYYTHSNAAGLSEYYVNLKSGKTTQIKLKKITVKSWKSSNKKVAKVKNGKVVALKKGSAMITAVDSKNRKHYCMVNVKSSPRLAKNGKTVKSITVHKGRKKSMEIKGKVRNIDNKYTNTHYAKIISKESDKEIIIRGLKRGTTTLNIKVNGVKNLKLQVNVK